jgi:preprotein translocase subunit SecE
VANGKDRTQALQPVKGDSKAIEDKKSQAAPAKVKKATVQSGSQKKRRFAFFSDITNELRKVVWPTRQETIRLTLIVIGICLIMGLVLGVLDYGFSELVAKVFLGGK